MTHLVIGEDIVVNAQQLQEQVQLRCPTVSADRIDIVRYRVDNATRAEHLVAADILAKRRQNTVNGKVMSVIVLDLCAKPWGGIEESQYGLRVLRCFARQYAELEDDAQCIEYLLRDNTIRLVFMTAEVSVMTLNVNVALGCPHGSVMLEEVDGLAQVGRFARRENPAAVLPWVERVASRGMLIELVGQWMIA